MAFSFSCLFVLNIVMQLLNMSNSCILLLNGWDPLSVYERAELAEVVIGAKVIRTFKTQRTSVGTYSAEIQILNLYKGEESVRNISNGAYRVFNVSNFGDKTVCYADVTKGKSYLLFLTIFKGRLSAKYDDIFGAADDLNADNEQEVLEYLGWNHWSDWSSCTQTCNSGHQIRRRTCSHDDTSECIGTAFESRECNTFPCKGHIDILANIGIPKLPLGVTRSTNRPSAYVISTRAKLFLPVSTLYGVTLPRDFAILVTIKLNPGFSGYLLSISDIQGRQRVGLYFGNGKIRLDYLDDNYFGVTMPTFNVDVTDGQWHHLAISLKGNDVLLYKDCTEVIKQTLKRSDVGSFGSNLMLSLGPYFPRYGNPFEGELEQLVLSDKPEIVRQQCYFQSGHRIEPIGDGSSEFKTVAMTTALPTTTHIPTTTEDPCSTPCLNGGVCELNGRCRCALGYQGDSCQYAVCHQPCLNGGSCMAPNQCACPNGYTGTTCDKPICPVECKNGGRCVAPGKCECPSGFSGPDCKPFCSQVCHNGGVCTRHNVCKCPKGYTGADCSQPVCSLGCFNGGKCVSPEKCSCLRGYRGQYCHKAKCRSKCLNKGRCVSPDTCLCRNGYTGSRCEQFKCTKKCKNGGTCIGPNKCQCVGAFYGRRCHREKCSVKCVNGGTCRRKNKCKCPKGFSGKKCEIRNCKYEQYMVPYKRSYRKVIREEFVTKCGPWKWKRCVQTRLKYVTVAKETFRTSYRCV